MDDQKYVTRLMRAQCTKGTMSNYLNVDVDHGVVVGADLQPLMNANDHVAGRHVIHFDCCESDHNPERMFRKALVGTLMGGLFGGLVANVLEAAGILTCKCKPNTPNPWEFTNEKNIIDGAPALLFGSVLTCRYGGCIKLLPEDQYPPAELAPETEEEATPEAPAYAGACDAVQSAISNAMSKVSETGTAGAETVKEVKAALALAAAMPPQPQSPPHSCEDEPEYLHDLDDLTHEHLLPANDRLREQNYAHNKAQALPPGAVNQDGLIIDQSLLDQFHINRVGVDYGGCGAIAFYNAVKILNPNTKLTFADAIYHMEPYGILSNTFGSLPTGISHCLNKLGYETEYVLLDSEKIREAAAEGDAAVVLYATTGNVHYVAFTPTGERDSDTQQPTFNFYNETGTDKDHFCTYEAFTDGLTDESRREIAQIAIIIHKKDDPNQ